MFIKVSKRFWVVSVVETQGFVEEGVLLVNPIHHSLRLSKGDVFLNWNSTVCSDYPNVFDIFLEFNIV